MKASAKKCMTAGVALVGAGVIAAGPVAPAPANYADKSRSYEVALTASTQGSEIQRQIEARQALLENFALGGLLEDFIEGTLAAYNLPGKDAVAQYNKVTGLESFGRIGQGFAASGLRLGTTALAPLRLIELAQAISDGEGTEAFQAFVTNIVDAPLWVIDPALFSLRDALPAPLGGPDGLVMTIRHQLYLLTGEINAGLQDPGAFVESFVKGTIDAFERKGPVAYDEVDGPIDALSRVTEGTIASALRLAAAAVLGPVGVIQVAAAVAQGDTEGALKAVENIVDGPLWVADPVLYGFRDALPAPLGGTGNLVENFRNGLWSATERINDTIRDVVGAPEQEAAEQLENDGPEAGSQQEDDVQDGSLSTLSFNSNEPNEVEEAKPDAEAKLSSEQPKSTEQNKQAPAVNVVRQSQNFSPNAVNGAQEPKDEKADDVLKTDPSTDDSTPATTGTTGGTNANKQGEANATKHRGPFRRANADHRGNKDSRDGVKRNRGGAGKGNDAGGGQTGNTDK